MKSNFYFLKNISPDMYKYASDAEKNIYNDPRIAVFNLGLVFENIIYQIFFIIDSKWPNRSLKLSNLINRLKQYGIINEEYENVMNYIDKIKNLRDEASHANKNIDQLNVIDENKSITMLKGTYCIAKYFYITYIKHPIDFKFDEFRLPKRPIKAQDIMNKMICAVKGIRGSSKALPIGGALIAIYPMIPAVAGGIAGVAIIGRLFEIDIKNLIKFRDYKNLQSASLDACTKLPIPADIVKRISSRVDGTTQGGKLLEP